MQIAFIGNGRVTRALSHSLREAGHDIVIGSRAPDIGAPNTPTLSHAEAVAAAEIVINAVPGAASLDVFRAIEAPAMAGKILVDVGNAVTSDIDLLYPDSSLGERLQRALPETYVVKTANTTSIEIVANPRGSPRTQFALSLRRQCRGERSGPEVAQRSRVGGHIPL